MKKIILFPIALAFIAVGILLYNVNTYEQAGDLQKIKAEFELVDMNGNTVTQDTYKGERLIVAFGYLNCVDVCPVTLATLTNLIYELEDNNAQKKYRMLYITVDPERDTQARLKEFITDLYHPDIVGLTGTKEQIDKAAKSFGVRYEKYGETNDGYYSMIHNTYLFAVDEYGKYQTYVAHTTAPPRILEVLKKYWKQL